MTKELLLILSCVPLYVVNSFCDKFVSTRETNKYNYVYNAIKFFICSICIFPVMLIDNAQVFSLGSILCGATCGIMYAISKTVMLKGYEKTSVAFMTLCHASGMILPCIIGHFFWSESLSVFSVVGIILAISSIVLLKGGKYEKSGLSVIRIFFGVITFFTSAGVMITQKFMGIYFADQNVGAYNFYSFFVAFLIICCFIRPSRLANTQKKDSVIVLLCAFGSAVSLSVISFVMTSLSGQVPSVVLFPLFNGLGIIFVCIGSVFVFKEKLNKKRITGMILGVLGLCLVNF